MSFSDDERRAILDQGYCNMVQHPPEVSEPEPRQPTIHEIARDTPNNAVAKWAADGEAVQARRKAAAAELRAQEERETATKLAAMEAARDNRTTREFLRDMLPGIVSPMIEYINERDAKLAAQSKALVERTLPVDLPNPIRRRMQ